MRQVESPVVIAYEGEFVTVWCKDALAVLPGFESESVQLVVTDPPYGVAWESGFRAQSFGQMQNDDSDRDLVREVLRECTRVISRKRHLYAFGPPDVFGDLKVSGCAELIWDKGRVGAGNLSATWGPQHERITFAVNMFNHAGRSGDSVAPARIRNGSVLRFYPPTGRKVRHPSEKPVPLLRELIESSSRVGDTVLDPFAGIGSTGVAAVLSGRRAVLVEIEPRYCSLAVERCAAAEELYRRSLTL